MLSNPKTFNRNNYIGIPICPLRIPYFKVVTALTNKGKRP